MLRELGLCVVITALAAGCSNKQGYVHTSLDSQRDFTRTAHEVRVSDRKRHEKTTDLRRELLEVQQHLAAGDVDAATRLATAAVKKAPDSADAHTYLAVALSRGGAAAGAGKHYRRAAELSPGAGAALGNYGTWLCAQGHAAESLTWFDRAIAVPGYPNLAMALANAGICATQAGQADRAERDLRRAIALDPANAAALGALAERELQAGNAFTARAFSERRLAAAPPDAKALLLASQIEQKLGDTAAASRYVARLKEEFPDALEARDSTLGNVGQ